MCTNVSGTLGISFHRLPLKNPELLKIWLIKIRRENAPVNEHSRVCSEHFKDGKKQGKDDIPVVFAWTKPSRPPPKSRHTVTGTDVASEDVEYNAPVEDSIMLRHPALLVKMLVHKQYVMLMMQRHRYTK